MTPVGRTRFDKSLDCCGLRATLALFGQSSGTVPPVEPGRLARTAFSSRAHHRPLHGTREELLGRARDVFDWVAIRRVKLRSIAKLRLRDAARRIARLEARETTGKVRDFREVFQLGGLFTRIRGGAEKEVLPPRLRVSA